MTKFRRRAWIFIATVVTLVVFYVAKGVYDWDQQLKAEYATASVIQSVTKFVELHHGQWPRNWADLPDVDYARGRVRMNFDVRVEDLEAEPKLIQTTIVPISGVYRTYPHAERKLDELRDTLIRIHEQSGQ